ncbi:MULTISPECIES: hypothetical protein [Streptomyces]|uniref:hypothetical protein n=1 Tax=Streptomyces TaxID=1883 RepID=UPI000D51E10D|nr:hypothetical protein [Streptomyces sp. CS081A]PVC73672.1 hypothetical protein DBP18_15205 [Streptomyces sp. CS081A]
MMSRLPYVTPPRVTFLLSVLAIGMTISACSKTHEEKREYALPHSLCGVEVAPDLLSPFLPPGEKLSVKEETPDGGTETCELFIDGQPGVFATQIWWREEDSITEVASVQAMVGSGEVSSDQKYLHSGTGAVGMPAGCVDSDHPQQKLYTVIQVFAAGRDDKSTMKQLITDYTTAVEKSEACPHDAVVPSSR